MPRIIAPSLSLDEVLAFGHEISTFDVNGMHWWVCLCGTEQDGTSPTLKRALALGDQHLRRAHPGTAPCYFPRCPIGYPEH